MFFLTNLPKSHKLVKSYDKGLFATHMLDVRMKPIHAYNES